MSSFEFTSCPPGLTRRAVTKMTRLRLMCSSAFVSNGGLVGHTNAGLVLQFVGQHKDVSE